MTKNIASRQNDEARAVYLRFRRLVGTGTFKSNDQKKRETRVEGASVPFGIGRDPLGLSAVIDGLTSNMGWTSPLAQSDLVASWVEIAGAETAEHSTPVGIEDGVLTVQCDSTAWATQLRLLAPRLVARLNEDLGHGTVRVIKVLGPTGPPQRYGRLRAPGSKGPGDTYG
jgi:predicted nucleic acid-binding Zn ribbon protein